MRTQVMSDLHTERYGNDCLSFLFQLQFAPDLDLLILAGDVVSIGYQSLEQIRAVFSFLSKKAKNVLYITGNHEYYDEATKSPAARTWFFLQSVMPENFHWVENDEITIGGVHFYAGCMWFVDDPLNPIFMNEIWDFTLISDIRDWVYEENRMFTEGAAKCVRKDTIVVSHHLPCNKSVASEYIGSNINRFFLCDQTKLIMQNKPRLWIHGHTHFAFDYVVDETRVLCNPYGYPRERIERAMKPYAPVLLEL